MRKIMLLLILTMISLSAYGIGDKGLAGRIAKRTGVEQSQGEEILAAFKEQVIADLAAGEEVRFKLVW